MPQSMTEYLFQASRQCHASYQCTRDLKHLIQAIGLAERCLISVEGENRAGILSNLCQWQGEKYRRTGELEDLNTGINRGEMAVEAINQSESTVLQSPIIIDALAAIFYQRHRSPYQQDDDLKKSSDLTKNALEITDQQFRSTGQYPPARASILSSMARRLNQTFMDNPDPPFSDLMEIIGVCRESVTLSANASPLELTERQMSLANCLSDAYDLTQDEKYLREAYGYQKQAVENSNAPQTTRASNLCDLGTVIWKLSTLSSGQRLFDESIKLHGDAVKMALSSGNKINQNTIVNCYSTRLLQRFRHHHRLSDLLDSIRWARQSVDKTSPNDSHRSLYTSNLCDGLVAKYEVDGDADCLREAIERGEEALRSSFTGNAALHRAKILCTLCKALRARMDTTAACDAGDLEQVFQYGTQALQSPRNHVSYPSVLTNMSQVLAFKYERFGDFSDLESAIHYAEGAKNTKEKRHQSCSAELSHLGVLYGARYTQTKDDDHLNQAVALCEEAVKKGERNFMRLHNLAYWLRESMKLSKVDTTETLDKIIELEEESLSLISLRGGHLNQSKVAFVLAEAREARYQRGHRDEQPDDRTRSKEVLEQVLVLDKAPAADVIHCAILLAAIASTDEDWRTMHRAAEAAVNFLPLISARRLRQRDQQYLLSRYNGMASKAASAAVLAGKSSHDTLQLLERGRTIITSHRFERQVDISHMKNTHPDLAANYERLCHILDSDDRLPVLKDDVVHVDQRTTTRHGAERDLMKLVENIRHQPGYEGFLKFSDPSVLLNDRTNFSIVVLNVSSFRSDAFVIKGSGIDRIHLPADLHLKGSEYASKFRPKRLAARDVYHLFEWLWDLAISPILDSLGITEPGEEGRWAEWPRICWVPTGFLSHMPVHAAGYHLDGSKRTVLDRVVSSYSPSIKFLEYAYQHSTRTVLSRQGQQPFTAVVVSAANTKMRFLPAVQKEVKFVSELLSTDTTEVHTLLAPTKAEVLEKIPECDIFHFAGHARADENDPLLSGLLVKEGAVTIEDLIELKLHLDPPFLAYLSACSTSRVGVDELVDEGIQLAGTFLAAGYRHVIASMWEINDNSASEAAQLIYQKVLGTRIEDTSVALSLHQALRELRDRELERPRGSSTRNWTTGQTYTQSPMSPTSCAWTSYIYLGYET